MNLKFKWHLRQIALGLLASLFSLTSFLFYWMAVRAFYLYQYGLAMYPNHSWPKQPTLQCTLSTFYSLSIHPLVILIPLTIVFDLILRRFLWKLDE